jgi:hypothetical protein
MEIRASNLEILPNYKVIFLSLPSVVSDKYSSAKYAMTKSSYKQSYMTMGLLPYFKHSQTNTTMTRLVLTMVHHFIEETIPPSIHEIVPDISIYLIKAVEEQEKLGWDQ